MRFIDEHTKNRLLPFRDAKTFKYHGATPPVVVWALPARTLFSSLMHLASHDTKL